MRTKEDIRAYHREYKRKVRANLGLKTRKIRIAKDAASKEILENLYVREQKELDEIGFILGLKASTILKKLNKYSIPVRRYESVKIGDKFGDLEIISRWQDGSKYCKVKCKCNKIFKIRIDGLKKKSRLSCNDCAKIDNIKLYGYITKQYWRHILYNASKRDLEFNITPEYINGIYTGRCVLSGLEIQFAKSAYGDYLGETTASLDRIDSDKGYIAGNVQWVHKDINRMKQDLSESKFIELCCLVADLTRQKTQIH